MNCFAVAQDTLRILRDRKYEVGGKTVCLPDTSFEEVIAYDPECGEALIDVKKSPDRSGRIVVTREDSYEAAARYEKPLVMNFANSLHPGGGFKMGANAQEEALCRASTLYASIASETGKMMYEYNATHPSKVSSDYMLLSPTVFVFRGPEGDLLEKLFSVAVITVPAPNRAGAAFGIPLAKTAEAMEKRIRIMLSVAYENNYKNLVLGAWGCGAFRNEPKHVAEHFRKILIDEGYAKYFDEICFAVYCKPNQRESRNLRAFRLAFDPDGVAASETKPGTRLHLPKVLSDKETKEKRAAAKAERQFAKAEKLSAKAEKLTAKAEKLTAKAEKNSAKTDHGAKEK